METLDVNIPEHKVKWQVSLSNGETFYEGKGQFIEVKGELSPWQKLIKYTVQNRCLITSLSLFTDKGQRFNLPSAGKNPKFKAFGEAEKPIDFCIERKVAFDMDKLSAYDFYTVGIAVYPSYRLQIWVNENNPDNCWVLKA